MLDKPFDEGERGPTLLTPLILEGANLVPSQTLADQKSGQCTDPPEVLEGASRFADQTLTKNKSR